MAGRRAAADARERCVTSPALRTHGLVRFATPEPKRRRLYCLPFAGGGPATYRLWPRALPSDVDVVAAQFPGRDPARRETPVDSIHAVVEAVVTAIRELEAQEPLPFVLFGHSMGALVAYEATLVLEQDGGPAPTRLFVSGRRPPDELHQGADIHALPDDEFLDEIQRSYGGVPEAVRSERELLALFLPSLRADIRALETYAPSSQGIVRCPVRVYGGARDRNPRPSQLAGWQRVAERDVSIRVFDGDHFYLVDAPEALMADLATSG
jgi:medium-chain acyl-[acyl-carrier-protein] hydrolase